MALTSDPNYKKLEQWYKANAGSLNMRAMFDADKDRFSKFRFGKTFMLIKWEKKEVEVEAMGV